MLALQKTVQLDVWCSEMLKYSQCNLRIIIITMESYDFFSLVAHTDYVRTRTANNYGY